VCSAISVLFTTRGARVQPLLSDRLAVDHLVLAFSRVFLKRQAAVLSPRCLEFSPQRTPGILVCICVLPFGTAFDLFFFLNRIPLTPHCGLPIFFTVLRFSSLSLSFSQGPEVLENINGRFRGPRESNANLFLPPLPFSLPDSRCTKLRDYPMSCICTPHPRFPPPLGSLPLSRTTSSIFFPHFHFLPFHPLCPYYPLYPLPTPYTSLPILTLSSMLFPQLYLGSPPPLLFAPAPFPCPLLPLAPPSLTTSPCLIPTHSDSFLLHLTPC